MDGYVSRALDLAPLLEKNTVFLFGPRQTGKSSYVHQQLGEIVDRTYNLLDQGPLGGRGRDRVMRPLTWHELGPEFDLLRAFRRGLIPSHYLAEDPEDALDSYVGRYLTEEIAAEGLARNIPDFSRFLTAATVCNAQEVVFAAVASDAGLARQTVLSWFNILEETLLGEQVQAWTKTVKRNAIERAKFYLFDLGVVRALRGFPVVTGGSADFGPFFEHFVYMELAAWRDYRSPRSALNYWRSTSGFEVDFILANHTALEVKATVRVDDRDLRGLRALKEEGLLARYVVVCREATARLTKDGIEILPWQEFLGELWNKASLS